MRKFLIFGLLLSFALILSCSEEQAAEQEVEKVKSTPVKTMKLSAQTFSNYLNVTGTMEARNHIQIMVEESGTVKSIVKKKGSYARAGELIIQLENAVLAAQYEQAKAALQQAELNNKSFKVLYDKRAISENEYLTAKYAYDSAKAAYNLTKARFDKLSIKAPLNGIVNERFYDRGAYATPMTPIVEFIDIDRMKVRAGIAERFLSYIKEGTPVELHFDAYPNMTREGKVSFVSRSINPSNRTFMVEVELDNADRKLAPNMVVNMRILREAMADQIVVPLDALVESEKGWYVFVKDGEKAKRILIDQQAIYENQVLVGGLSAGQELITVGHRELSDGDLITVSN